MPYCFICNKNVEVSKINKFPEYEQSVFDCGHTSKHIVRSIVEGLTSTENIEVTPKEGEKIPVTASGDTGIKIQGELAKVGVTLVDNRPVNLNININTNTFNAPLTDVQLNQNISQTSTIDSILANLDQSSLSVDKKNEVRSSIEEFRRESEQSKPDEGKLKSILSKVFPIAKDIGMMLFKHAIDHNLLSTIKIS